MLIGNWKISPIIYIVAISVPGFIIGVVSVSLWQDNWLLQADVLSIEVIREMNYIYIDKRALFFLCLGKRLRAFFILIFMSRTSMNLWTVLSYFFFRGYAIGSIMELLLIRYGVQGELWYFTFVFPQGVLYFLGYLMVGIWCLRNKNGEKNRKAGTLIVSFIMILAGILMESLWNEKFFLMNFFE